MSIRFIYMRNLIFNKNKIIRIKVKFNPFAKTQLFNSKLLKKSKGINKMSTNKYSINPKNSFIVFNFLDKSNK